MEISYLIPNEQILTIIKCSESNTYYYRIGSNEVQPIDFDNIYTLMQSLRMTPEEIPHLPHR